MVCALLGSLLKYLTNKINLKTKETITPHTFRHSFATMFTEEGESLYKIQKISGHKSINSTIHYIKAAKTVLTSSTTKA